MKSRIPLALLLLVALYVSFRALILYTNFDAVCMPKYELAIMGNIAKVAQGGWKGVPLVRFYDNCGGHLTTGLLAVPLYATLGETYLSLKLVPFVLGLLTLVLLFKLLDRCAGRRAAVVGSLLFTFAPPTLAKYSVIAKGNHFENLFFQFLVLWLFYRLHASEKKERWLIPLGAAAGFAVFFYFGSLVMLALLLGTHVLIRGPLRAVLDLRYLLPGVVLGLAPLIAIEVQSRSLPTAFLFDNKFSGRSFPTFHEFTERLSVFFRDVLPRAGVFEDLGPIPGSVGETLFLTAFVVAWLALAPGVARGLFQALVRPSSTSESERARALRYLPFVLYLPVVTLAVGTGNFKFKAYAPPVEVGQFRYLVPHFAFACVLIGAAAGQLWSRKAPLVRTIGAATIVLGLTSGLFALPVVDWTFHETGLGSRYDGYLYRFYNGAALRNVQEDPTTGRITWDHAEVAAIVAEFPYLDRHEIYFGIGHHLAWAQTIPRPRAPRPARLDLTELLAPYPVEFHVDLVRGAGACLRKFPPAVARKHIGEVVAAGHPLAPYLVEGLALDEQYPLVRTTAATLAATARRAGSFPPELEGDFQRGRGVQAGRLKARGLASDLFAFEGELRATPAPLLAEFWFGVGFGMMEEAGVSPGTDLASEAGNDRAALYEGGGAAVRHLHGRANAPGRVSEFEASMGAADRAAFERGAGGPDSPLPSFR